MPFCHLYQPTLPREMVLPLMRGAYRNVLSRGRRVAAKAFEVIRRPCPRQSLLMALRAQRWSSGRYGGDGVAAIPEAPPSQADAAASTMACPNRRGGSDPFQDLPCSAS